MAILFVGSEDVDFRILSEVVPTTFAGSFRTDYCRSAVKCEGFMQADLHGSYSEIWLKTYFRVSAEANQKGLVMQLARIYL